MKGGKRIKTIYFSNVKGELSMNVMQIGAPGSIYKIEDKVQLNGEKSFHRYLIIGIDENNPQSFYQSVVITSMCKKEVTYELPIMLDGMISYITPYNIHSLSRADLYNGIYKGSIIDNETYKVGDFISLIADLHYALIFNRSMLTETEKRYKEYCNFFFKTHSGVVEYRTTKPEYEKKAEHQPLQVLIPSEKEEKISASNTGKKKRRSRMTVKEPEGFQELLKEYNDWRISITGISEELGISKEDVKYLLKGRTTRKGKFFSKENPYANLYKKGYTRITDSVLKKEGYVVEKVMRFDDISLLQQLSSKAPQNVIMWSLQQKSAFVRLYEKYGCENLSSYQKRWSYKRLNEIYKSCKTCYAIKEMTK